MMTIPAACRAVGVHIGPMHVSCHIMILMACLAGQACIPSPAASLKWEAQAGLCRLYQHPCIACCALLIPPVIKLEIAPHEKDHTSAHDTLYDLAWLSSPRLAHRSHPCRCCCAMQVLTDSCRLRQPSKELLTSHNQQEAMHAVHMMLVHWKGTDGAMLLMQEMPGRTLLRTTRERWTFGTPTRSSRRTPATASSGSATSPASAPCRSLPKWSPRTAT